MTRGGPPPATGRPSLEARGIQKRFGRTLAVDGVDISAAAGEAVALLGPNGSGKTTLLRLCAGLCRPSRGEVLVFGAPVRQDGSGRRRLGYLGHHTLLYPDLSPEENLRFYGRLYGVPALDERIASLTAALDIRGWHHRPVRTLSRGMQQRTALARLFLHQPAVLLLDEPFTALDRTGAARMAEMISAARDRGAAVLLATHDLGRAAALCHRAVILRNGRVVWQGDCRPELLEEAYTLAAGCTPGVPPPPPA